MIARRGLLTGLGAGAVLLLPRAVKAAVDAPYRRMTNPLLVPINADGTASSLMVPTGFFTSVNGAYTSFDVTNPNNCFVRLQGFTGANAASGQVTSTTGWCFPPGFKGTYTTQLTTLSGPAYLSAMLFDTPLFPIANVKSTTPLELTYGYGA